MVASTRRSASEPPIIPPPSGDSVMPGSPPSSPSSSSESSASQAPASKRQRPTLPPPTSSLLYTPYHTLGNLTTCCQPSLLSTTPPLLTCSLGNSYVSYSCGGITPSIRGPNLPKGHGTISSICSDGKLTCVSTTTNHVLVYSRVTLLNSFRVPSKFGRAGWLVRVGDVVVVGVSGRGAGEVDIIGDDDDSIEEDAIASDDGSDSDSDSDSDDDDSTAQPSSLFVFTSTQAQPLKHLKTIPLTSPLTSLHHPDTYMNKFILGTTNGLELWNINSSKMIYKFKEYNGTHIDIVWGTPDCDTICFSVKAKSGDKSIAKSVWKLVFMNVKLDKVLFDLEHNNAITSVCFSNVYTTCTVATYNDVFTWDLQARTLLNEIRHGGDSVTHVMTLPNSQAILLTSLNTIKMYNYDTPSELRLIKHRTGHTTPPKAVKYLCPATNGFDVSNASAEWATNMLTYSSDGAMRNLCAARSVNDVEYSQGKGLEKKAKELGIGVSDLKLPPIIDVARVGSRKDYGDIVSIHTDSPFAYVWSSDTKAQSGCVLKQKEWSVSNMKLKVDPVYNATSVDITACGNFVLVGCSGGSVFKYNVQSGQPRGEYPIPVEKNAERGSQLIGSVKNTMKVLSKGGEITTGNVTKQNEQTKSAAVAHQRKVDRYEDLKHECRVVGVFASTTNQYTVSVDSEGKINKYSFTSHAPTPNSPHRLNFNVTNSLHVRGNELMVVATTDFSVMVVDLKSFTTVRRLSGHTGIITGMDATPDARRVFTTSLDKTLRVWDVPTGQCVDWLAFHNAPTSVACGPTSEFLATTHVDSLGVSLWSDKSFYQSVYCNVSPKAPVLMTEPELQIELDTDADEMETTRMLNEKAYSDAATSKLLNDQNQMELYDARDEEVPGHVVSKAAGLVTFSGLPQSHWKSLFKLELVKLRNKPIEPPKKPEAAPFFLQQRRDGEDPFAKLVQLPEATKNADKKKKEVEVAAIEEKKLEGWDTAWSEDEDEDEDAFRDGNGDNEDGGDKMDVVATGATDEAAAAAPKSYTSKIMKNSTFKDASGEVYKPPRSQLAALLLGGSDSSEIIAYLGKLNPSGVDVAIRTLCSGEFDPDGIDLLVLFAKAIGNACAGNKNFECVNAYLGRFLYIHGSVIRGPGREVESGTDGEGDRNRTDGRGKTEEEKERRRAQAKAMLGAIEHLKLAQEDGGGKLKERFQYTMSLLRTFSKFV